jgi:hypothetical protein
MRTTLKAEKDHHHPSTGEPESSAEKVDNILIAETIRLQSRPWNRLEKGVRIQKIREWIGGLSGDEFSDELKTKAENGLITMIRAGELNSTSSVIYDTATQKILKIPAVLWIYGAVDEEAHISRQATDVIVQNIADKKTKRKKGT